MATLERIRNKAGIIVAAVIGLALLGFILQDLFDSRKSLFKGTSNDVGKIAGVKISVQRLEQTIADITEDLKLQYEPSNIDKMQDQIREQAWQQIITEEVMDKEYKKLGVVISPEELSDYFLGANPDPNIRQIPMFIDQKTGQFSKAIVQEFLNRTKDGQNFTTEQEKKLRQLRLYLEKMMINQKRSAKYVSLITKGLSAPKFLAKNEFLENEKKVDFNFIVQQYTKVADNEIKVSPEDLKNYYKEHEYLYEQPDDRRDVEYVSFDVAPSKEDRIAAEEWINKIKPDFVSATEVELFVNQNSENQYNDKAYSQNQLSDTLGKFMFKASVGDVFGPYYEGESYKLARLYKILEVPDSVKTRHILIVPKENSQEGVNKAKALADSLKNVIEKDKKANFEALAKQYSADPGSADKGGDVGWINEETNFVKPYKDFAFEGKKGETKVVESKFGYHVIQITDRSKEVKKVKVAFIEHKLLPSQHTYDIAYAKANKFAGENRTSEQFNAACVKQNLLKRPAANIGKNDKDLPGLELARQLVKWAFKAKKNEVSEPFTIGDRYVIATLTGIKEKGTAPLEAVRSQVELEVRKIKKAEKLADLINKAKGSAKSIQDLALKLNTPVETAIGINFNAFSVPNAGAEPKLIAVADNIQKDKLSAPIDGNNGVYVVYVTNVNTPQLPKDWQEAKQRLNYSFMNRAYDSYRALVKAADIKDDRSNFY
jgi:peptidyl-prolyl cis-trans isomerase D